MQGIFSNNTLSEKLSGLKINPWVAGSLTIACALAGVGYYTVAQSASQAPPVDPAPTVAPVTNVTALGRLEPKGEVIKVSVVNAQDSRVNQLLVKEGDRVEAGQVIAILQGLDKKKAALAEAQQNVAIARAKLAKVRAGDAKQAEFTAQQANIARLDAQLRNETAERDSDIAKAEATLRNAERTYQRYQSLYEAGAGTAIDADTKRRDYETAQAELNRAIAQRRNTIDTLRQRLQQERAALQQLREVRPVDIQVAQAEVDYAQTQVARAKADLEDLYVRAPIAGQILKINTRIGEQVNTSQGIVELGQTEQMYAIAEVYETDVARVRVGQTAKIVSENGGFPGEVRGTVEHVGLQIKKQDILDADPAADKDARVVEVKVRIRPEDTAKVAGLTNMQVRVQIQQ